MGEGRKNTARKEHSKASPATSTPGNKGDPLARQDDVSVPRFLATAPRQPRTADAWKHFASELTTALRGLEEDEWLVLSRKNGNRFVQFMNQGGAGYRAEAVSDFYLGDEDRLSERDRDLLLELGWGAPTNLPDEFGYRPDGSPNYFLDLADPVPLDELAVLAVNTLAIVHRASTRMLSNTPPEASTMRPSAFRISEFDARR